MVLLKLFISWILLWGLILGSIYLYQDFERHQFQARSDEVVGIVTQIQTEHVRGSNVGHLGTNYYRQKIRYNHQGKQREYTTPLSTSFPQTLKGDQVTLLIPRNSNEAPRIVGYEKKYSLLFLGALFIGLFPVVATIPTLMFFTVVTLIIGKNNIEKLLEMALKASHLQRKTDRR